MSKYSIQHSCGHTVIHNIVGPTRDRDRKAEWIGSRPCEDCWRAEQDRQRQEANAAAAESNQAAGLPTLTGSPKQIAWAETIRARALAAIDARFAAARAKGNDVSVAERKTAILVTMTASDWWIEHRNDAQPERILAAIQ